MKFVAIVMKTQSNVSLQRTHATSILMPVNWRTKEFKQSQLSQGNLRDSSVKMCAFHSTQSGWDKTVTKV